MKNFEYKIFELIFEKELFDKLQFKPFRDIYFIEKLNEIGKEGWEVCNLDCDLVASFYKQNYSERNKIWTPPVFPILCKREL